MREYKTKIDWHKVERFMDEVFPKVKSDLESRLPKLNRIKPELTKGKRPPAFYFHFVFEDDGTCGSGDLATEIKSPQVKANLPEIAQVVGEVSEENNLKVHQNRGISYYDSQGSGEGFVGYELKPNYQDFRK